MNDPRYPFATGDYLALRPNYSYCDCSGADFPELWRRLRHEALLRLAAEGGKQPPHLSETAPTDGITIDALLDRLTVDSTQAVGTLDDELDRLVQRFEAGKRLYDVYRGIDRRGDTASGFRELSRYVRFGELLVAGYRRRQALPLLNALLKLCDLLCAHTDDIFGPWRARAAQVLIQEASLVEALAHERGMPWPP